MTGVTPCALEIIVFSCTYNNTEMTPVFQCDRGFAPAVLDTLTQGSNQISDDTQASTLGLFIAAQTELPSDYVMCWCMF